MFRVLRPALLLSIALDGNQIDTPKHDLKYIEPATLHSLIKPRFLVSIHV